MKFADNQFWNSCCRVVCDHEFTFSSAMKRNVLGLCFIYGRLLQPACGPEALVNTFVLCSDQRLEFGGKTIAARLVHGIVKKMRHKTTEDYILIGPRS